MPNLFSLPLRWTSVVFLAIISMACGPAANEKAAPVAKDGIIDLTGWDFSTDGPVDLEGEWLFFWEQLLTPENFQEAQYPGGPVEVMVPGPWASNNDLSAQGHGTYYLKIKHRETKGQLALKAAAIHSSYTIWFNNELLVSIGKVAKSRKESVPRRKTIILPVTPNSSESLLIIQVSNFQHRAGGIINSVSLGIEQQLQNNSFIAIALKLFLIGAMGIMGLYYVGLFFLNRRIKSSIYFAALCFLLIVRIFFVGEPVFVDLYDPSFETYFKFIYLSFYLGIPLFLWYTYSLFEVEAHRKTVIYCVLICLSFSVIVLATPTIFFSYTLIPYQLITVFVIIYVTWISISAIQQKKEGANYFLASWVFLAACVLNDILNNNHIISTTDIMQYGFIIVILSQAFIISLKSGKMLKTVEKLSVKLMAMDKLKDEFLANTSHELRTPINGIIGISDSLIENSPKGISPAIKQNLLMISASGRRLANLINDILDFSKLKNTELALAPKPTDINTITNIVLAISQHLYKNKDLNLTNNISKDCPLVYGDEDRLQQILYNLIGNAIKFTEKGTISISSETIKIQDQDDMVKISVSDTGKGIPKSQLESIFESFEQGDGTVSREYGGTGLGLSITKQLVNLHGGSISVESEVNKGSVFSFTVPSAVEGQHEPDVSAIVKAPLLLPDQGSSIIEEELSPSFVSGPKTKEHKGRVLIVDDDPINLQVLVNRLEGRSYSTVTATSGREALEFLFPQNRNRPDFDIVLLDVMMPTMSGYEVCEKIREKVQAHKLPVVLLTARTQIKDLLTGFKVGANDYLAKPFSGEELLTRIDTHLGLLQKSRALEEYSHTLEQKVEERTQEIKGKNDQLTIQKKELESMNHLKDKLLSVLSHDVRAPLNSLKAIFPLFESESITKEEFSDLVSRTSGQISQVSDFLENLVRWARNQLQGFKPNKSLFNLKEISDRLFSLYDPMALEKNIALKSSIPENLKIYADKESINLILRNLLTNAIKFCENGDTVDISVEDGPTAVKTMVTDTGIGMSEEIKNSLFDEAQISSRGTGDEVGAGLGLLLCRDYVEKQGGNIGVESELGKGSLFWFTVPKTQTF